MENQARDSQLVWKGYAVHDTKMYTEFKVIEFQPKKFEDYDIDIKIEYCGVCGSDVHSVTGGWGMPMLVCLLVPGHEITGIVVAVGKNVSIVKQGDRVGVGAQVCSCLKCERCTDDNEQYCLRPVATYNDKYPNGHIAYGGYSTAIRVHERYVFPIPDGLSLEHAAPMLCGGLTVYSPLVRHGAGPGKKVGIVGVGGLGHFAIQFAKALGSEVFVFSHSASKKEDAVKMGADHFIETGKSGFAEPHQGRLDLIICTADVSSGIPLSEFMTTLRVHARLIMVAMPDDRLPSIQSSNLAMNGTLLGGSRIGSKKEVLEMLDLAVKKSVKPWIEMLPMCAAGKAIQRVKDNEVRYRHVLKVDI